MKDINFNDVIFIDTSKSPLIIIKFKKKTIELEDVKLVKQEELNAINNIKTASVIIYEASEVEWVTADARLEYIKLIKEQESIYDLNVRAHYFVLPSKFLKIVLNTINRVFKPKIRQMVCNDLTTALEYAELDKEVIESIV
ncbi:hypothetical protein KMW28_25505 [Flammeovirga yaeyamensis]|uniref:Uncharacterized protein n=1 Tax=Flammeovirga yaeyamensis TaxID=367791 RepID=A0AAX1NEH6_9BACT|nr:hypothetical protein [Flammeovirga yaeyamensis]MBB3699347.1 hypothetical protein [Flammeovirga yaeyamensis]NMF35393.1 hypothetical protein [Flammeovirga yaeyamensis]QWG04253.1 hypothetical protein KMW28_25505 [Flammeovirga yaeyamensis]